MSKRLPVAFVAVPRLAAGPFQIACAMSLDMEQTSTVNLSPSERLTLRHIAEGEWHITVLDWVAIQRLKCLGLVEERGGTTMTTKEGQRALGLLAAET